MTLFETGPGDENAALKDIIADRIRREGPITFRDFMDLALYHPFHGYYLTCDPTLDYQSSPNVHPAFGACIARQLAEMWRRLGQPARFDVVEAGAGNGRLAGDIARWLRGNEPGVFAALHYRLQDATYLPTGQAGAEERSRANVEWVGLPPDKLTAGAELPGPGEVEGCVLSNELIDAFPVHRVRVDGGRLAELRVGLDGDRFVDVAAEPSREVRCYFERLALLPGEGCEAEVNLEGATWLRRAASMLRRGYVMTLDYGYEDADLFAPWRRRGTLLTFYRHSSGEDPYARVGRQDITASVDFTSLMRAGDDAALRTLGLTTQAEFLAALGIGDALAARPEPAQLEAYYALRRSVVELTDTTGLGRIKVLVQGKGAPDEPLRGLQRTAARA